MHAPAPAAATVPRTTTSVHCVSAMCPLGGLKVDVEGYEPQVLATAGQMLAAGRIEALLIEVNKWCDARTSARP